MPAIVTFVEQDKFGIRFQVNYGDAEFSNLVNAVKTIPGCVYKKAYKQWWLSRFYWKELLVAFKDFQIQYASDVEMYLRLKQANWEQIKNIKIMNDCDNLSYHKADKLYPFQRVGVRFLSLPGSKFLADEAGIGKTMQTIALCEEIESERNLIVCPNSLKLNWIEEINKWADNKRLIVMLSSKMSKQEKLFLLEHFDKGYLVLNYESVRGQYLDYLMVIDWDIIAFDESIKLKNPQSLVTKNCSKLIAKKKIALSGAAITKSNADLFSQLRILVPEKYNSYWSFAAKYSDVERGAYGVKATGSKNSEALKMDIYEFTIRRTKKEVRPQLPDKIKQTIRLEQMPEEQNRIYKIVRDQILAEIDKQENSKLDAPYVITKLLRLSQVASTTANLDLPDVSAKLDFIQNDIMEECIENSKIVLWSVFRPTIFSAAERLKEYNPVMIIGNMPVEERQANIHKFNEDPNCRLFMGTMQTGKYGFSLVPEDGSSLLVIYIDRNFDYDNIVQSEERTMRITSVAPAEYLTLIQQDTVDEYTNYNLLQKEAALASIFRMDSPIVREKKLVKNLIIHPEQYQEKEKELKRKMEIKC